MRNANRRVGPAEPAPDDQSWTIYNLTLVYAFSLVIALLMTVASIAGLLHPDRLYQQLVDSVPERIAGGALTVSGVTFALLAIGTIVNGIVSQTPIVESELALQVSDFIISVAWIIGGALLWRREPLGYVTGTGLLFRASMLLFVGLLVYFALQPILTATPFPVVDFVAVSMMGLIVFVPFGLFVRGITSEKVTEL